MHLDLFDRFDRIDPAALAHEELAPLESILPADWPEQWREFATSLYITLVSAPGADAVARLRLARLAMELALGLVADHGGEQPYIPVGAALETSSKARRVIELLGQGESYRKVADATGLTESRVRRIEADWRRQQWSKRQCSLPLD